MEYLAPYALMFPYAANLTVGNSGLKITFALSRPS